MAFVHKRALTACADLGVFVKWGTGPTAWTTVFFIRPQIILQFRLKSKFIQQLQLQFKVESPVLIKLAHQYGITCFQYSNPNVQAGIQWFYYRENYTFPRIQRGSNIFQWGGCVVQLLPFTGRQTRGKGVQILISIEPRSDKQREKYICV